MDTQSQPDKPNDEELFDKVVEENEGVAIPVTNKPSEPPVYAPAPVTESEPATAAAQPAVTNPVPESTITVPAAVPVLKHGSSGGTLALQWISYAFWGWFAASLSFLAGVTFAYFIIGDKSGSIGGSLAYPLASVIVMLLAALVADMFYARHEPEHKVGGANVILLLHSVVYILVAVGALITAVFSLLSMLLDTPSAGTQIALWTALTSGVAFTAIVARMTLAGKRPSVRKSFWVAMVVVAVVMIGISLFGPAAYANKTRDDRLIEQALPQLAQGIKSYADKNNKLPATLEDAKDSSPSYDRDQVNRLIDQKLVTYKPNMQPTASDEQKTLLAPSDYRTMTGEKFAPTQNGTQKRFYYQLCVTYKEASENDGYDSPYKTETRYDVTPSTYNHPKGNVCYDLVTDYNYAY